MRLGRDDCVAAGASTKIIAIIPARYASERFPGKVIAPLAGKPLVVHTYERTRSASLITDTVIATDDERVVEAVAPFDVKIVMTRADHATGTDRIAEVAAKSDADIIVNVQADEPLVDPNLIDATIQPLLDDPGLPMATARYAIHDPARILDPNCVKVVCDGRQRAMYFSRSAVPFIRDAGHDPLAEPIYWQHIGLYVFRREFLLEYAAMTPTPLERYEKLEQLRVLEHGFSMAVIDAKEPAIGVDTPEDLDRARAALEAQSLK